MTRRTIAAAVTGLVSLSLVGVALASEPDDPALTPTMGEGCEDVVTDESTTDGADGTDDGTTDGADETDDGTTDGTTDEADETDDGTTDGTDDVDCEATDDPAADGTDGTGGTDGTDGTDGSATHGSGEGDPPSEGAEAQAGQRPQNHGWYVSEATKTCPESGRERGECISAVAQSDLGKPPAGGGHAERGHGPAPAGTGEVALQDKPSGAPGSATGNGGGRGRGAKG